MSVGINSCNHYLRLSWSHFPDSCIYEDDPCPCRPFLVRHTRSFCCKDRINRCAPSSSSWEFLISFDFDWGFITRKKPFTWPMVCIATHSQPRSLIKLWVIQGSVLCWAVLFVSIYNGTVSSAKYPWRQWRIIERHVEGDCVAYITSRSSVYLSLGAQVSTSLSGRMYLIHIEPPSMCHPYSLHRMLIWSMNKYCVIPLCALIIGHWAILGHGTSYPQSIHLSLLGTFFLLIILCRRRDVNSILGPQRRMHLPHLLSPLISSLSYILRVAFCFALGMMIDHSL